MHIHPYISFVVVARNDNYGGDFLSRINVFIRSLITLCEKYKLPSELIVVEWNPPKDKPLLRDAISWPTIDRNFIQIRIIEIPNDVHRKLPNPEKMCLFEYIGKNVGVRRAQGEYVLATNPDVIFGEELIKFLVQRELSPECFYRIDRHDVRTPIPIDIPVEKQLEYCEENITGVHSYWYYHENKLSGRFNPYGLLRMVFAYLKRRILSFPFSAAHVNASGDFFLTYQDRWKILRGYPELETKGKSHHIDSLIVYMAQFSGLRQIVLKNPLRLYHVDHARSESSKPRSQVVRAAYKKLRKARKLVIFNNSWGMEEEQLLEFRL